MRQGLAHYLFDVLRHDADDVLGELLLRLGEGPLSISRASLLATSARTDREGSAISLALQGRPGSAMTPWWKDALEVLLAG